MINLRIEQVTDPVARDNFVLIQEELRSRTFLKGKWRHVEIEFDGPISSFKFAHNLGFKPKDILTTSVTGPGSVTWHFEESTREHIYLSTTDACVVRAFIGSYREE